jgi:hypothetical protein
MLDEEKERQMTATSGRTCLRLYDTQNPNGSSLKTCVASLLGTKAWYSKQCALTWKAKVTKSNRLLFQLSPSVRHTEGIESGLLPTATTQEVEHKDMVITPTGRRATKDGKDSHSIGLMDRVAMLPTPDAGMGSRGARQYVKNGKSHSMRTVNALIGSGTGKKLRLQPAMTQWMMGYPDLWTEFPLAEQDGEKTASKPTGTE